MILLAFICGTLWLIWWVYAAFVHRSRRLAGATVVVTGACSEVGRRLCLQLCAHGARVIAWDCSRIRLQELQAEVLRATISADANSRGSTSGSAVAVNNENFTIAAVDSSSRVQVQRAAKELDGPIDLVINAAHTYPVKPLHERADDSIDRVFQTNLVSPLLVVRQLLPLLLATPDSSTEGRGGAAAGRHGRGRRDDYAQVVNIVCGAGNYAVAAHAPDYAASQWGMVGLHYSMRAWIAQERAAFSKQSFGRSSRGDAVGGRSITATTGGSINYGHPGGWGSRQARDVRTTLLFLNDIQNGIPSASNFMPAPTSLMQSGPVVATSTLSPNAITGPNTPNRNEAAGGGGGSATSVTHAASPSRESYASTLQRHNAQLDRAVSCCVAAIRRGEERYCYATSWMTTLIFPAVMICPLPWAERLLCWLQRSSD